MKRIVFLSLMAVAMTLGACATNDVGRVCFLNDRDGGDIETVVASPALECQSRTCLHWYAHSPDLCTAECGSDGDCDKVPESPCRGGFACVIPVVIGPFCCKKMCVCKDYLGQDGGVVTPAACDDSNPLNECCNLSGRRANTTQYPKCATE